MLREKQGELGVLDKKSNFEIKELLKRQEKILANKSFLNKLPDKGEKVQAFVDKLRLILEDRGDVDSAARLLDTLSLGIKERKNEDTNADITDNSTTSSTSTFGELFTSFHSNVFAKPPEDKTKFRPNRTLRSKDVPENIQKSNIHVVRQKQCGERDITAAYSPALKNEIAKSVSLEKSLELQSDQQRKLQTFRAEQAAEKLSQRLGIQMGDTVVSVSNFREPTHLDSDDEEESDGNDGGTCSEEDAP